MARGSWGGHTPVKGQTLSRSAPGSSIDGLIPIASSKYQTSSFKFAYLDAMTQDISIRGDLNLDGWFGEYERLAAVLRGMSGPHCEQYRAALEITRRLADHFPKGFMSLGRMDSGFSFVQGRSAMITSGSWDAKSYLKKIQDQPEGRRFEVGIFRVPMIDPDDPEFGRFFDGKTSEATSGTTFSFGVTRFSKNLDLCVEFLKFCTTPENNVSRMQAIFQGGRFPEPRCPRPARNASRSDAGGLLPSAAWAAQAGSRWGRPCHVAWQRATDSAEGVSIFGCPRRSTDCQRELFLSHYR